MIKLNCNLTDNIGNITCSSSLLDSLKKLDAIDSSLDETIDLMYKMDRKKTIPEFQYIGCYKDTGKRALPIRLGVGPFKATACHEVLKKYNRDNNTSYRYFSNQGLANCFIGNDTYDIHGKADENDCQMNCAGGKNRCGGYWRNSVHKAHIYK